ncbi:MAG: 3-deoxy-7-phosphoheptulonate synthase, partial [Solirubrobacterales bacterium]
MMIVMKEGASEEQIQAVVDRIEKAGANAHVSRGQFVTVIGAVGDADSQVHEAGLELADGVDHVVPIMKPYKLSSLQFKKGEHTTIEIEGRKLGGGVFSLIAGPCTVESRDQLFKSGEQCKA